MDNAQLTFIDKGENAAIYSICFNGDNLTEFEKFITKFKDNAKLQRDFQIILQAVNTIMDRGALERYFRTEGRMNDNVCALPITSGKLRLYCIRLSDKILIAGNGGIKTVATYQESEELKGYVMDLQKFDDMLNVEIKRGAITIEKMDIIEHKEKGGEK